MNSYILRSNQPIFPKASKSTEGSFRVEVDAQSVSDGYHTMDELYEHRIRLFMALLKAYDNYITPMGGPMDVVCWKSKLHDNGDELPGWFLAGMVVNKLKDDFSGTRENFNISYHLPNKYWDQVRVLAFERAPKWDGHTSADVLERLLRL